MKNTKGIVAEFKDFISRGNVMDMAIGIIMGSAFTAIVNSLVKDIVMPAIGLILGGVNFANLKIVLTPASEKMEEAAIYYGSFLQKTVDFLVIALVVFLLVKQINRFHKRKEEAMPSVVESAPTQEQLLTEIRDLLKSK